MFIVGDSRRGWCRCGHLECFITEGASSLSEGIERRKEVTFSGSTWWLLWFCCCCCCCSVVGFMPGLTLRQQQQNGHRLCDCSSMTTTKQKQSLHTALGNLRQITTKESGTESK